MRRPIYRAFVSLVLFACSLSAQAQYQQYSTNPSSFIFGVFKVELELPLKSNFAIEPEFSYLTKGQRFWTPDYATTGFRAGVMLKKYLRKDAPHEGWYGMAYYRYSAITFSDFAKEGDGRDQRGFDRIRSTPGFGFGFNSVGNDGFTYGFALGVGRHVINRKDYTTEPIAQGTVFDSDDAEIIQLPVDIYGRISVGYRIFTTSGRATKDAFEAAEEARIEEMRERLYQRSSNPAPATDRLELEERRELHRLRNGNG